MIHSEGEPATVKCTLDRGEKNPRLPYLLIHIDWSFLRYSGADQPIHRTIWLCTCTGHCFKYLQNLHRLD